MDSLDLFESRGFLRVMNRILMAGIEKNILGFEASLVTEW
jgi:hypothetical protein